MLRVALDAGFACKTSTTSVVGVAMELNQKPQALGRRFPLVAFSVPQVGL